MIAKTFRPKWLQDINKPPRIKFKVAIVAVHKFHNKVDEAFNILSLSDSVVNSLIHCVQLHEDKYETTLHHFQTNFSIASKVILLSKIIRYILISKNLVKDTVANYTLYLFLIIFVTEYFLS